MSAKFSKEFFCFICALWILGKVDSSKRNKRELKFPKDSSFALSVALASYLPKGLTDGFAHVLEFDFAFPFPEEFALDNISTDKQKINRNFYSAKNKRIKKFRTKSKVIQDDRRKLIIKLEDAITRIGHNGSSCILRFQCELHKKPVENSLMEDLLRLLFQISSPGMRKKCEDFNQDCPVSLLQTLFHSEQIY